MSGVIYNTTCNPCAVILVIWYFSKSVSNIWTTEMQLPKSDRSRKVLQCTKKKSRNFLVLDLSAWFKLYYCLLQAFCWFLWVFCPLHVHEFYLRWSLVIISLEMLSMLYSTVPVLYFVNIIFRKEAVNDMVFSKF